MKGFSLNIWPTLMANQCWKWPTHGLGEQLSGGSSPVYCVVIQEKGQPDITDRSYNGRAWMKDGEADRQHDNTYNTHESISWPVFQNKIWQHIHLSYIHLCGRKANRLGEVCCSQTVSLPGSNPSARWLQRGREMYLEYSGLLHWQATSRLEKNGSRLRM